MSDSPAVTPPDSQPIFSPALIELGAQFISVQAKEAENKALQLRLEHEAKLAEIKLREKEIDVTARDSGDAVAAMVTDRADDRKYAFRKSMVGYVIVVILSILFVGTLISLVHMGQGPLAVDLIKFVATALVSGGGGYAYGQSKGERKAREEIAAHLNQEQE